MGPCGDWKAGTGAVDQVLPYHRSTTSACVSEWIQPNAAANQPRRGWSLRWVAEARDWAAGARAQCELVVYRAYNILPGHSLVFVAAQCDNKTTSSTVRSLTTPPWLP